jgi:hypothetical protein
MKNNFDILSELGCVVCRLYYDTFSPAEIHHLRTGQGMGQKRNDLKAIPLCPNHHRLSSTESFHLARKAFEEKFGTEATLFEKTNTLLLSMITSRQCGKTATHLQLVEWLEARIEVQTTNN